MANIYFYCIVFALGCLRGHLAATLTSNGIGVNPIGNFDFLVEGKGWRTLSGQPTKIIGHRGEKVLMPEHTVGAYEIASIEHPEFVEPDLVLTKDGHLICFHDLTLKVGTNVEQFPEFAKLKDITAADDWFIPDFTLEQIKKLKVKQTEIGIRPQYFNDIFHIPTFEEFLDVIHEMSFKLNRSIGIIPELKHPEIVNSYFQIPHYMETQLVEVLKKYGYAIRDIDPQKCQTKDAQPITCGKVIIQCFNTVSLRYLKTLTDIDLMMLVEYEPNLLTMKTLDEVSVFAQHFCVWKEVLFSGIEAVLKYNHVSYNELDIAEAGGFIPTNNFAQLVHEKGMELGIYTIYDSREPSLRGCEVKCQPENKTEELFFYFDLGVDAMFVENIKEALELRLKYDFSLQLMQYLPASSAPSNSPSPKLSKSPLPTPSNAPSHKLSNSLSLSPQPSRASYFKTSPIILYFGIISIII